MEEDESEEIIVQQGAVAAKVSSTQVQQIRVQSSSIRSTFKSNSKQLLGQQSTQSSIVEEDGNGYGPPQIVTHEPSGDSDSGSEGTPENSKVKASGTQTRSVSQHHQRSVATKHRFQIISKSAQNSSSSQEDYETDIKYLSASGKATQQVVVNSNQYLTAGRVETAKSMESLRTTSTSTHNRSSFLTSSERDMRRITSGSVEGKSLESLERETRMKRRAISGEDVGLGISCDESISAEKRRGLFAGLDRRNVVPQHLSLPPPGGYTSLSPGDRRLTILSPHSPHHTPDLLQFSQTSYTTLKTRRKKAIVLPRLVLPRSDSEASSDVFLDHDSS